MQILDLVQGSEEWKATRLTCFNGSEAPIMMGASPFMSRDDLLKYKTTGDEQEINRFQQIIFDKGHAAEAGARPLAEIRCFDGDELFPITGLLIVDGMRMLASFDGLVMPAQDASWEHKQFNKELYELVQSGGELEPKHYWQLEHQALVADLEKVVFTVSDGTDNNKADLTYIPRAERRAELIAHWKQFARDLEGYQPQVYAPLPAARVIEQLPALAIDLIGEVKESNITHYQSRALSFIRNINTDLQTDEDFVDAENTIKFCEAAEKELELVKKQALNKTATIAQLFATIDSLKEEMRRKRLELDKLVKSRKDAIRLEIINSANAKWSEHLNLINEKLKPVKLPAVSIDFVSAIKGKKTVKSLNESANNELARAKVEADSLHALIAGNLEMLREIAGDYKFLFSDIQNICAYEKESLRAVALQRINEHKLEQEHLAEAERIKQAQVTATTQTIQQAAPVAEINHSAVAQHLEESFETVFGQQEQTYGEYASAPEMELPFVDLDEFNDGFAKGKAEGIKEGVIQGLDLALQIFAKHGAKEFAKVVEDFIEVGAPDIQSKAA